MIFFWFPSLLLEMITVFFFLCLMRLLWTPLSVQLASFSSCLFCHSYFDVLAPFTSSLSVLGLASDIMDDCDHAYCPRKPGQPPTVSPNDSGRIPNRFLTLFSINRPQVFRVNVFPHCRVFVVFFSPRWFDLQSPFQYDLWCSLSTDNSGPLPRSPLRVRTPSSVVFFDRGFLPIKGFFWAACSPPFFQDLVTFSCWFELPP